MAIDSHIKLSSSLSLSEASEPCASEASTSHLSPTSVAPDSSVASFSVEKQTRAADPTTNAWVSASAGTGKTKVLTDRVLSLLVSGVAPEKILCLTFTKAAAQEMSERVMLALSTWATLPEATLQKTLQSLLPGSYTHPSHPSEKRLLDRAKRLFNLVLENPQGLNIQTLHSFCQSFLQRFPLEASLTPGFVALDEKAQKKYLAQAQQEVLLNNPSEEISQALFFLSKTFGVIAFEEKLTDLILTSRRPGNAFPDKIDQALEKELGMPVCQSEEDLLGSLLPAERIRHLLGDEWQCLSDGGSEDQKRFHALKMYTLPDSNLTRETFESLCQAFLTKTGSCRARLLSKKWADKYPTLEKSLEKIAVNIQKTLDALQINHIAQISRSFLILGKEILKTYESLKERQGLLDYDDLINKSVAVLKNSELSSWVLYKMDGGLDHILLDEAQDTNAAQWQVIEALTEEFFSGQGAREVSPTIFVVGDVKQSIYSFQGANPSLFEIQRHHFRQRAQAAQAPWQDIGLNMSFRSCATILKTVDAVFEGIARQGVRTLEEHPLPHDAFRAHAPGRVEVWPLVKEAAVAPEEETREKGRESGLERDDLPKDLALQTEVTTERNPPLADILPSSSEKLAQKIAHTIQHWIQTKRWLPSQKRSIEPSDILILLQRRGPFLRQLHHALKKAGVPVSGEDRLNLQDQLCVQDLVALGRFLLLPEDDLSLACLLKSPLLNVTEEQLFKLCHQRSTTLWAALIREGHHDPDFQTAYSFLSKLLSLVDRITPYELYSKVLNHEGKQDAFLKRLGPQALDPLQEFIVCVRQYEERNTPSLQGFLTSFSQEKSELKRDFSASSRQEVRLMTVHGSKGLQAPIVFLPDTVREPRLRESFLWQGECPLWNPTQVCEPPSLKHRKKPLSGALQEEYHRLLYVAMTRAEDELYIAGFENTKGVRPSCWYHLVSSALVDSASPQKEGTSVLESGFLSVTPSIKEARKEWASRVVAPAWAYQKAPLEKTQTESLAATDFALKEEERSVEYVLRTKTAKTRGTLFHKIIEQLPRVIPGERGAFITKALAHQELDSIEKERLQKALSHCLKDPDLGFLLSGEGVYEVPISGELEGQIFTGQIDFLLQTPGHIKLIDFKTNKRPATCLSEVPDAYCQQLKIYKRLLSPLYPNAKITTWILWTASHHLMCLEDL